MCSTERAPRFCFVTTGATADFNPLIRATLSPPFLKALQDAAYTDLVLQHGIEGTKIFNDFIRANKEGSEGRHGLRFHGFDFNKHGLADEMRIVKGEEGRADGVVISHAGML